MRGDEPGRHAHGRHPPATDMRDEPDMRPPTLDMKPPESDMEPEYVVALKAVGHQGQSRAAR